MNKPDFPNPQDQLLNVEYYQPQIQQKPPQLINLTTDIEGLFETVSAVPTGIPKTPYEQVKIYVNGATLRLYWYDTNGATWHYVTATA